MRRFLLLLAVTNGLASMAAAQLTAEQIRQIAATAKAETPPGELAIYPMFSTSERKITSGKTPASTKTTKIQFKCLYSTEGYVVQTRTSSNDSKPFIDLIQYDDASQVYRRWQLDSEDQLSRLIGVHDSNEWAVAFAPQATKSAVISWSGIDGQLPQGTTNIVAIERTNNGPTPQTQGISWKCRHLNGEAVVRFESFNIRAADDGVPVSLQHAPKEFPKQLARRETSRDASRILDQLISGARRRTSTNEALQPESQESVADAETQTFEWASRKLKLQLAKSADAVTVPPEQIHPNAILAVYRPDPFQTDVIIAHSDAADSPESNDIETWIRKGISDLKTAFPDVRVGSFQEHVLNDRPVCRTFSYSPQQPELTRCHTFFNHAQTSYQFVTTVNSDDANLARKAADSFIRQLEFPKDDEGEPSTARTLVRYGLQLGFSEPTDTTSEAAQVAKLYPAAQLTQRFSNGDFIALVTIRIDQLELTDEQLRDGLIACTHPSSPTSVRVSERFESGTAKGVRIVSVLPSEGRLPLTQETRLVRNGSFAIGLVAGMFQRGPATEAMLKQRLDNVTFVTPKPETADGDADVTFPVNHFALNRIGQTLVRDGHYKRAVQLFTAAQKAAPDVEDYRRNADRAKRLNDLSF